MSPNVETSNKKLEHNILIIFIKFVICYNRESLTVAARPDGVRQHPDHQVPGGHHCWVLCRHLTMDTHDANQSSGWRQRQHARGLCHHVARA